LTATELVSDIAVKRDISKPMQRSEVARHGQVKGLFGGRVLLLTCQCKWQASLSKKRLTQSSVWLLQLKIEGGCMRMRDGLGMGGKDS